jgi:hypothetical protein
MLARQSKVVDAGLSTDRGQEDAKKKARSDVVRGDEIFGNF